MSTSVIRTRKRTSHTFHLIMSILTLGAWAVFVWWPLAIWHKIGPRQRATIEHHGSTR